MKKFFQAPEMEVEVLSVMDVVTASVCDDYYEPCDSETPGI